MSEKESDSSGMRKSPGLRKRSKEVRSRKKWEKGFFVPSAISVPQRPSCRCDN